ncbi:MAG: ELWxxDGT repeat protein [Bermanella sp.]|jgi:ELWxxDGT repeat protein
MKKGIITAFTFSLLAACGSGSSNSENKPTNVPDKPIEPIDKVENQKPIAQAVSIIFNESKTLYTGDTLEGTYQYTDNENDPEGNTQLRWLVDGIEKGTSETYTIKNEDADKKITLEVTPIATTGTIEGSPVSSNDVTPTLKEFIPYTTAINGLERVTFVTDGTESGTKLVKDFSIEENKESIINAFSFKSQWLLGIDTADYGTSLAITDGTQAGTDHINIELTNLFPSGFVEFQGKVFFRGTQPDSGTELWVTDGTSEGTELFLDLAPGNIAAEQAYNSYPRYLTVANNKLIFSAYSRSYGTELWVSDGTPAGTTMLKDINVGLDGSNLSGFYAFNDKVFFNADSQTYVTDGTPEGTKALLVDNLSNPNQFLKINDSQMVILANNLGSNPRSGLWISDGTEDGTELIDTQNGNQKIYNLTIANETLYYTADNIIYSYHPEEGTKLISDRFSLVNNLLSLNDQLYFHARNRNGSALYTVTNNSVAFIKQPSQDSSAYIEDLYVLNDSIVFKGSDEAYGIELWISDGSESGTHILQDTFPGPEHAYPALCHLTSGCRR